MTKGAAVGTGVVLPPGAVPPTANLAAGPCEITIESVASENPPSVKPPVDDKGHPLPINDSFMAKCVYPDGFTKEHQVKTVSDLMPKVINQVRARYGFKEAKITKVPKALKAGEKIALEVTNG